MNSWKQKNPGLQIDPPIPSKVIDHIIFLFKYHIYLISDWFSVSIALLEKLM